MRPLVQLHRWNQTIPHLKPSLNQAGQRNLTGELMQVTHLLSSHVEVNRIGHTEDGEIKLHMEDVPASERMQAPNKP